MQKRLVRKLELEMFLSQVKPHPHPKPNLEQYTIPASIAANILYIAAYTYNDIINKNVLDLGCGTGRLAIGAAFLGAKQVVGVDIDKTAVKLAFKNSVENELKDKLQWVAADINAIRGKFDTVLQNPPFGVQKRSADRAFLKKAMELGNKVYSLHKSLHKSKSFIRKLKSANAIPVSPSPFLKKFIKDHGGEIKAVYAMLMTIPHMFPFHTKKTHEFVADLYIIKTMR